MTPSPPAPPPDDDPSSSFSDNEIRDVVLRHVDEYQREGGATVATSPRSRTPRGVDGGGAFSFDDRHPHHHHKALAARVRAIRRDVARIQRARAAKEGRRDPAAAAAGTTTSRPDAASASPDDLAALLSRMSVEPPASERSREEVAAALVSCLDAAVSERARDRPAAEARRGEESARRVLELVAAASRASGARVAAAVRARAFAFTESPVEAARAAACFALGASLRHGGGDEEADAATEDRLAARTTDRAKSVRQTAAEALGAAPRVLGTAATDALLRGAARDPSFAVRAACLEALPVGGAREEEIARAIARRVRDVKDKVRSAALDALGRRGTDLLQTMAVEDRTALLRDGLSERCSATRAKTLRLLCCRWARSVKFDVLELLRLLEPEYHEAVCAVVVKALSDVAADPGAHLDDLGPPERRAFVEEIERRASSSLETLCPLDAAAALFVRAVCVARGEEAARRLVPDAATLCDALEDASSSLRASERAFVRTKLWETARSVSDLRHEEGSRRRLLETAERSLTEFEDEEDDDEEEEEAFDDRERVAACVRAMAYARDDDGALVRDVARALKRLLRNHGGGDNEKDDPADEPTHDLAEEHVNDSADEHTSDPADDHANDLDPPLPSLSSSFSLESAVRRAPVPVALRALHILSAALEIVGRRNTDDEVLHSFSQIVVPAVTSPHPAVQEEGVDCLGKFALLSDDAGVVDGFRAVLRRVGADVARRDAVRARAVMALCDTALLFGDDAEHGTAEACRLLSTHDKETMRVVAAEATAKLAFAGRARDPDRVGELLTRLFDDDDDDDDDHDPTQVGDPARLRQLLALFFPAMATTGAPTRQLLARSLRPALATDLARHKTAAGPAKRMVEYVCSVLDEGRRDEETRRGGALPDDEDAVLTALGVVLDTLYENRDVVRKTHDRTLCRLVKACVAGRSDESRASAEALESLIDSIGRLDTAVDDETAVKELDELEGILENMIAAARRREEDDADANHENEEADDDHDDHDDDQTVQIDNGLIHSLKNASLNDPLHRARDAGPDHATDAPSLEDELTDRLETVTIVCQSRTPDDHDDDADRADGTTTTTTTTNLASDLVLEDDDDESTEKEKSGRRRTSESRGDAHPSRRPSTEKEQGEEDEENRRRRPASESSSKRDGRGDRRDARSRRCLTERNGP